jgi:hypothetical protein
MYHAHFYNDEIVFTTRTLEEMTLSTRDQFFETKEEALASLGAQNWERYEALKTKFEQDSEEIILRKDKIYHKIVEVFNERKV